jgi:hypothetical protein
MTIFSFELHSLLLFFITTAACWLAFKLLLLKLPVSSERILGLLTLAGQILELLTLAGQLLRKCTCRVNYPDKLWLLPAMAKNQKLPVQWISLRNYL